MKSHARQHFGHFVNKCTVCICGFHLYGSANEHICFSANDPVKIANNKSLFEKDQPLREKSSKAGIFLFWENKEKSLTEASFDATDLKVLIDHSEHSVCEQERILQNGNSSKEG